MGKNSSKASRVANNSISAAVKTVVEVTTPSDVFDPNKNKTNVVSSKVPTLPDGITIVWVDARANSKPRNDCTTTLMLRRIHSSVLIFDDVNDCLEVLGTTDNSKSCVFLIVSGKFSNQILSSLNINKVYSM